MTRNQKIALIGSLLAGSGLVASAASLPPTNAVEAITLTLMVTSQGPTSTNDVSTNSSVKTSTIKNSEVIAAIGKFLGSNYTASAKLLEINPVTFETQIVSTTKHGVVTTKTNLYAYATKLGSIVIQEGTNRTDVTDFFVGTGTSTNSAVESVEIQNGLPLKDVKYKIDNVVCTIPGNPTNSFSLQGYSVRSFANVTAPRGGTVGLYFQNVSPLIGTTGNGGVAVGTLSIGQPVTFDYPKP